MFDPKADLFFENPKINRTPPGDYGVLHLLRRDIFFCLGWDPTTGAKTSHPTLWPGGMAILAGIDLVAKFYKGDDTVGQVGPRFRSYVSDNFHGIEQGDEETIYQLRNALLHSFGLYSQTRSQIYRFRLSATKAPLVHNFQGDFFQLDLLTLHEIFEKSLEKYSDDLNNEQMLQINFLRMFPNYGAIHIG
jgi:hypothetical protein